MWDPRRLSGCRPAGSRWARCCSPRPIGVPPRRGSSSMTSEMSSEMRPDRSRVLLVGMGPTTETALESLLDRFDVVGLVRVAPPDDSALALAASSGVPVYHDATLARLTTLVAGARPDCVVVSSYDRILPSSLVATCPFVNVHYAP